LSRNDGSTDESHQIMESFGAKEEDGASMSWPNRDPVATLNSGIELATAELIIRMDAEDISRPERFEKQTSLYATAPDQVTVGARMLFIDRDGMPNF
jgi:glycosyltransferase involved in cell wall biosynthesis